MDLNENAIRTLVDRFGEAFHDGDLRGILNCWTVPALVLADHESVALLNRVQIEQLFTRAIHVHRYRGLVSEKPQIERIDVMSNNLISVDVRWPATDKGGTQKINEYTQYILGLDEDGEYRIRVALTRSSVSPR